MSAGRQVLVVNCTVAPTSEHVFHRIAHQPSRQTPHFEHQKRQAKNTMARLIHGVATATPSARPADPLTDLTRLLSRLQQTVLRADAEREARLRTSEFEREKVQTVSLIITDSYCFLQLTLARISTLRDHSSPSSSKKHWPSRSTPGSINSKPTWS